LPALPLWARSGLPAPELPGLRADLGGDQRRKLVENLAVYEGGSVVVLAVTAPGADELPWDESHCRPLGDHRHSGSLGCRVAPVAAHAWNQSASNRWRRLHRRAYHAVRWHGVRCTLLVRAFERQRRGVLHVHPVLGFSTPAERHAAGYLEKFAAHYGFGFTERRLRKLYGEAEQGLWQPGRPHGRSLRATRQHAEVGPSAPLPQQSTSAATSSATISATTSSPPQPATRCRISRRGRPCARLVPAEPVRPALIAA
jgi:hypothetical protein